MLSWKVDFSALAHKCPDFFQLLSSDEKDRANALRFRKDSEAFILTRAALRLILSEYTHIEAGQLRFTYNDFGKPYILKRTHSETVQFNVSHSAQVGYIAIAQTAEVGIDVEHFTPSRANELTQLAERFFSESECNQIKRMPGPAQPAAFYRLWTRKEAYLKALGKGLSVPLNAFEVSLDTNVIHSRQEELDTVDWQLFDIPTQTHYLAALATRKNIRELRNLDFPHDS